jgi:hypothetical protein
MARIAIELELPVKSAVRMALVWPAAAANGFASSGYAPELSLKFLLLSLRHRFHPQNYFKFSA